MKLFFLIMTFLLLAGCATAVPEADSLDAVARDYVRMQLEIGERCYMDQDPPYAWDPARAAPLVDVLRRLVDALVAWRPPA